MSLEQTTVDGVAVLRIARPPVNALDLPAILELESAFDDLATVKPKGLVLSGAGGVFSAGIDTRAFAAYGAGEKADMVRAITRMISALYRLPFPTVAAVPGHALGGGLVLVLACDVRLAADEPSAKLGLTEARAGVPFPAGPLEVIRAELPPDLLRRLTLTSAVCAPADLQARGVLDRLVPAAELEAASIATVAELASQPAFAAVKRQVRAPVVARLQALVASGEDPMIELLSRQAPAAAPA